MQEKPKLGSKRKKGESFSQALKRAGRAKSKNIQDKRTRKSAFMKKGQSLPYDINEIIEDGVNMSLGEKVAIGYTKKGLVKESASTRAKRARAGIKRSLPNKATLTKRDRYKPKAKGKK